MRNQIDYFDRVIKVLKELKKDHPDVEVSKHYILATDGSSFSLSDRELYHAFKKHQNELEINTLSTQEMEKVIAETEVLFSETDYDPALDGESIDEDYEEEF
jgi:pantothenate kinase